MIIDKIDNICLYNAVPKSVIQFLKNIDRNNVEYGKHILDDSNFVNIETYATKTIENAKYESHDKYIDIQILLTGNEKIGVADRSCLSVAEPYDENRDITFYSDPVDTNNTVSLNGSNFVMLYPHEAHAPQIASDYKTSGQVIKVVAKIKVEK